MVTLTRMKMSATLIILCIIVFSLSKTFPADKRIFTDDDLETYQYGNGKTESVVIENANKTHEKIEATTEANAEEESIKRKFDTITTNIRASK